MQRKSKSSAICAAHVLAYIVPFWLASMRTPIPAAMIAIIATEHFLQDRFAWHLKWMKAYSHSTSEHWPTGPLCVDQAMHVSFMAAVCLLWG